MTAFISITGRMAWIILINSFVLISQVSSLDIRLPPKIIVQGDQEMIVRTDSVFTLPCTATGIPEPDVEWFYNGLPMDFNARNIRLSENKGILFDPVIRPNTGFYQCFAHNKHGTAISVKTDLQLAELGRPLPQNTIPVFEVNEGDALSIPCAQLKSNPPSVHAWKLAEEKYDRNPQRLYENERIVINDQGTLFFTYTKKEDERNGFIYKCLTYNPFLQIQNYGSYAKIKVNSGDTSDEVLELEYATETPMTALVGSSIRLQCIFTGSPSPKVQWSRVGGDLSEERIEFKRSSTLMIINNAQSSDEGQYKCFTLQGDESKTFDVEIESRPSIKDDEHPKYINITEGNDVSFNCVGEGIPSPDIQWLINGVPANELDFGSKKSISNDGRTLTMKNLCKTCSNGVSDIANVQCNISNINGYVLSSGYVNVILPTVFKEVPQSAFIGVNESRVVHFDCSASTDDLTPLEIYWEKDDKRIDLDEHYDMNENYSLIINVTDVSETELDQFVGFYKCVAGNGYTSVETGAKLFKNTILIETASFLEDSWWWLLLAVIICLCLLICCIGCYLCKKYNKKDEYLIDKMERKRGLDPKKELQNTGFSEYSRPEDTIRDSRASLTNDSGPIYESIGETSSALIQK